MEGQLRPGLDSRWRLVLGSLRDAVLDGNKGEAFKAEVWGMYLMGQTTFMCVCYDSGGAGRPKMTRVQEDVSNVDIYYVRIRRFSSSDCRQGCLVDHGNDNVSEMGTSIGECRTIGHRVLSILLHKSISRSMLV